MAENPALFAAIIANPGEDTPRLAYADWLDENGEEPRARFIRLQYEIEKLPPIGLKTSKEGGRGATEEAREEVGRGDRGAGGAIPVPPRVRRARRGDRGRLPQAPQAPVRTRPAPRG